MNVAEVLVRRPGMVWLATLAIMAPFAIAAILLQNHLNYDLIGDLPKDAPSVAGTDVLQQHFPAGMTGMTTVLLVNPSMDFSKEQGKAVISQVTNELNSQIQELNLADVRSLTAPLGMTSARTRNASTLDVSKEAQRQGSERLALEHYVTSMDQRNYVGTRFDLVLSQNPFSHLSIDSLNQIEQAVFAALPANIRQSTQLYVTGATASVRDLSHVTMGDRARIETLVIASVFVILILLLQRIFVSAYLLLSVLFSYYATLGVTFAVFWCLDPQGFTGIDWKVAIFLFTILVAVGEDYNIFLWTRIQEESAKCGVFHAECDVGITDALIKTGPIISSCGIIMAGTFASLLVGSLAEMKQLGFALAFGVLLDTFVVRPILIPAFLLLMRRFTSWRHRKPANQSQA
jgi:RND superfamily putative drug exporter